MIKSTGSQFTEVYGSEEGKPVDFNSTLTVDMYSQVNERAKANGNILVIPDHVQHLKCNTGMPVVNVRMKDTIHLDWVED